VRRLINVELLTDNRLTPGEVQEQVTSIPLARLGRRGLDPEEVRAFCARLEHELLLRDTEAAAMQQYIQKLRMRVIQGPGEDTPAAAFQPGQVTAHRIVAEAPTAPRRPRTRGGTKRDHRRCASDRRTDH
jgi:hypothetical protein